MDMNADAEASAKSAIEETEDEIKRLCKFVQSAPERICAGLLY